MPTSMLRFFMTTWSPEDDVTEEGTVPVPNIGDEYQLNYEGLIARKPGKPQDRTFAGHNSQSCWDMGPHSLVPSYDSSAPTIQFDHPFIHQRFTATSSSTQYASRQGVTQQQQQQQPGSNIFNAPRATKRRKIKHQMPPPISPTYIEVIVGSPPQMLTPKIRRYSFSSQQTFHVPTPLLRQHSGVFSRSTISPVRLPNVNPHVFDDFLSYIHSSIYSPNTRASSLDIIAQILHGWRLGEHFAAPGFRDAAFAKLYSELEFAVRERRTPPPAAVDDSIEGADADADSWTSDSIAQARARRCKTNGEKHRRFPAVIDAYHVAFVCAHSPPGSLLRKLIFDATVALFDQDQAARVLTLLVDWRCARSIPSSMQNWSADGRMITSGISMKLEGGGISGKEGAWVHLFENHPDFKQVLSRSMGTSNMYRGAHLQGVAEYIPGFGASLH